MGISGHQYEREAGQEQQHKRLTLLGAGLQNTAGCHCPSQERTAASSSGTQP